MGALPARYASPHPRIWGAAPHPLTRFFTGEKIYLIFL